MGRDRETSSLGPGRLRGRGRESSSLMKLSARVWVKGEVTGGKSGNLPDPGVKS